MHQTDRVLLQFGFQQPIPEELEVLDEQHKIDLRLTINSKSYLLPKEQRHQQIRVERERRGPLNPRTGPTQSLGPMPQRTTPTS
ncbi:hypothetical protein PVK06_021116 [Gossypium arboreum]|uniref:Uncharacterized protein n=1 Tax=Gossypium arboreum TaxID=29729 RepID=A0ABR0PP49_GOSAR|nr:hypothetical protein PVK06_021116 [Gossypium arboreum]